MNPAPNFSRLAPLVVEAAEQGDAVAQEVLEQGGADLALLAGLVIEHLRAIEAGRSFAVPAVAIAGSVLEHVAPVREALIIHLRRSYPEISVHETPADPPAGALWTARQGVDRGPAVDIRARTLEYGQVKKSIPPALLLPSAFLLCIASGIPQAAGRHAPPPDSPAAGVYRAHRSFPDRRSSRAGSGRRCGGPLRCPGPARSVARARRAPRSRHPLLFALNCCATRPRWPSAFCGASI